MSTALPFFVSSPHSGEKIPQECHWLRGRDPIVLLRDVDRFVDDLYSPACTSLSIPMVRAEWSRYVVDLNRKPTDVDQGSVQGATGPRGAHLRGFFWQVTTLNEELMAGPVDPVTHENFVRDYYEPFHREIKASFQKFKDLGHPTVFHLDLHSMPSRGTSLHTDPGGERADIVISDWKGQSAAKAFLDLAVRAYESSGFQVKVNDPYLGGGITQVYGQPSQGQNTLQVELNRRLYMDEATKERLSGAYEAVQGKLAKALHVVQEGLTDLLKSS